MEVDVAQPVGGDAIERWSWNHPAERQAVMSGLISSSPMSAGGDTRC
jgi:hypothetical protein